MKGGIGKIALSLATLAALAPSALAQSTSVSERFVSWLNFLLIEATSKDEQTFLLYIKFIVFVIIFAAIFFGTEKVFTDPKHRKIRVAISLSLSLLAIVGLPDVLVRSIVVSYGLIAGILLAILPLFAIYRIGSALGDTTGAHVLRAALYLLMAVILFYFGAQIGAVDTSTIDIMTGQSPTTVAEVWREIGGWLIAGGVLCILSAIWQLFTAAGAARAGGGSGGGGGPNPAPGPAVPADITDQLRNALQPVIASIQGLAQQLEQSLAARDRSMQALEQRIAQLISQLSGKNDEDSQARQQFLQSIQHLIEQSNQQALDAQKAIATMLSQLPDALKRDNEQLLRNIAEELSTSVKSAVENSIKSLTDAINQLKAVAPPGAAAAPLVALQPAYTILPAIPGEGNVISQNIRQIQNAHGQVAAGGPPVIVNINNRNYIIGKPKGAQGGSSTSPAAPQAPEAPKRGTRAPNALDIRRALFERVIHQLRITVPDKASVIASIKISKKARTSAAELDEYMIETIHALKLTNEQKRALVNVAANEAEYMVIARWLS